MYSLGCKVQDLGFALLKEGVGGFLGFFNCLVLLVTSGFYRVSAGIYSAGTVARHDDNTGVSYAQGKAN